MPVSRPIRGSSRVDQIIVGTCVLLSLLALVLPATVREPVASVLRQSVLAPLIMLQERAELSRRAFMLHEERIEARDSVTLKALSVSALQSENGRLREIIGLGARLKWGFVPAEALHGRGVRDAYSVILSAGSNSGISRLSPVVAPEGLVGAVERVDPTMSQAILWTHPDFRVSAMSQDGSTFGIVQAHLGAGPNRFLMEMRGVSFRTELKPGMLVVSAGLGGTYPRGIPIGTVMSELKTPESWARTYILRPAVSPSDINSVMILRQERVTEGVEGVWQQGGPNEAALRAILAAGDSLARAAALQEAAARRSAIASMRTDSIRAAGGAVTAPAEQSRPVTQPQPQQPVTPSPVEPQNPPPQRDSVVRLGPPIGARRDTTPSPVPREPGR
ncbi:MAG TPA: rod shape-determining protein MreC [Gemmatimonadaceae bacterium]|nr:rod shape-determining protein MreC [Gemmatimonadaceae bacterium]